MDHTNLYIDGVWREGVAGQRFDVINPATEAVLASVASAEIADADAALDAAQAAFAPWAGRTPRQRSEVLRKSFELMNARLPEFARLITLENGKPALTRWARRATPPNFSAGSRKRRFAPTASSLARPRRALASWCNASPRA